MKITNLFGRLFGTKASATLRTLLSIGGGRAAWTDQDFLALAENGYAKNPYAYAGIRLISDSVAGIPWALYTGQGKTKTEIEKHPLLDLLKRPNPQMSQAAFFRHLVGHLYLSGNSYVEHVGPDDPKRPPLELYVLRPDRMRVVPSTNAAAGPIERYEYRLGSMVTPFLPEKILHLKLFNPADDWYGLAPLTAGSRSVDQNNEGRAWNVALLQNAARPSGALSMEGTLGDSQFERLKSEVDEKYAGSRNAGRPMLLEGGLKFERWSMTPADMDWLEGLRLSAREIAVCLNIPPELIGDSANKTYANYGEARKALYQECVLPLMDMVRDDLNAWLVPRFGKNNLHLDYVTDSIEALQEDRDKTWNRNIAGVSAGIITPNEARDELGFDHFPGADELLVSAALIPMSLALEPPEPVPAPLRGDVVEDEDEEDPDAKPTPMLNAENGSGKAFYLTTEQQKGLWFKAMEQGRAAALRATRTGTRRFLGEEREVIAKEIARAGSSTTVQGLTLRIESVLDDRKDDWQIFLKRLYLGVGEPFARRTLRSLKSAAGADDMKAATDDQLVDRWRKLTVKWLAEFSGTKIEAITKTTRDKVRRELALGAGEGESIEQLTKRIDKLYMDEIIPHRSEVIARTETLLAGNIANRLAAESTGLPLRKEWIATRDTRTRDPHLDADGQLVSFDQPYLVGGEKLLFPGDPGGGSPANTIQCRCTEGYHLATKE